MGAPACNGAGGHASWADLRAAAACQGHPPRGGLRRCLGVLLLALFCEPLLAASEDGEAPWKVVCNMDCDGVNTCDEQGLCHGEEIHTAMCDDVPKCPAEPERCAPKNCAWGPWGGWTNEVASGICIRSRTFQPSRCGGDPCEGNARETKYCQPSDNPPQDCEFSAWGRWGRCDTDTLQRLRRREIARPNENSGKPCEGPLSQTEPCGKRHKPVDCELGEWMSWSGCSRSCGGGQQLRMRSVAVHARHGGKLCHGPDGNSVVLQTTRPCNPDPCVEESAPPPQDCAMVQWSAWTSCEASVTGAPQQRYRSREVHRPGAYGGKACEDQLRETAPCAEQSDLGELGDGMLGLGKQDCQLSDWASWTLCDKTCEGGQTFRKRTVKSAAKASGALCDGATLQTQPCNEIPCTQNPGGGDCQLSPWMEWSRCSAACGQGVEMRTRNLVAKALEGGAGCNSLLKEARPCQVVEPCRTTDCAWGTWTKWSECSRSCDGGQRSRRRDIAKKPTAGGQPCPALDSIDEIEGCGTEPCQSDECIDGEWDDWEAWSSCSQTCGDGVQWRHRKVRKEASPCGRAATGRATEARQCSLELCEGDTDCELSSWSDWNRCSKSCDGMQSRNREILVMGSGNGKWCTNEEGSVDLLEVQSCNGPEDLKHEKTNLEMCGYAGPIDCVLGSWNPWSPCSATCAGGQRVRNRTILTQPSGGGQPCSSVLQQIGQCNTAPCGPAEDCEWDDWLPWGPCSRCDGEKTRTRGIKRAGRRGGRACDAGASREVAQCNECETAKVFWCTWSDWQSDGGCSAPCGPSGTQRRVRNLTMTEEPPGNETPITGKITGDAAGAGAACTGTEVDYATCQNQPTCGVPCEPQNCTFADWSDWFEGSGCNGLCTRHREIQRSANKCGRPCVGELTSTKACGRPGCNASQACELSPWSTWTPCTLKTGQQSRERRVAVPAGVVGDACTGNLQETRPCVTLPADEVDCKFEEWGEWQPCSHTCGGGQQERRRTVLTHAAGGGAPCEGVLSLTRACGTADCAAGSKNADCELKAWSPWEGCDEKGDLQASRVRTIEPARGRGLPCAGAVKETGVCPGEGSASCIFSDWAPWGDCGVSCGGGQRFRTREVEPRGGAPCNGDLSESEPCNEEPCNLDEDCAVSDWSSWTGCSEQCGQGQQTRRRHITQAAKADGYGCSMGLSEVRGCLGAGGDACKDDRDCEWGSWLDWSKCERAEHCGVGFRRRTREIAVQPKGKGQLCQPLAMEEVAPSTGCRRSCEPDSRRPCVDGRWGTWRDWGECSVSCGGGGTRVRSRVEDVVATDCGRPVEGDYQEYEGCSADVLCAEDNPDKQDCVFSDWGAWDPKVCSQPCNGARQRSRTIVRYGAHGGKLCQGALSETARCNPGPGEEPPLGCESGAPVDCVQEDWLSWSACQARCGRGIKFRKREVTQLPAFGGRSCENPVEEIAECNSSQPCADVSMDCLWGQWGPWSKCDGMLGQKERSRGIRQLKVNYGLDCVGPRSESAACPRTCKDKSYFCVWSDWYPWSKCSLPCGTEGRMTRKRVLHLSERHPFRPEEVGSKMELAGGALLAQQLAAKGPGHSRSHELALAFAGGFLCLLAVVNVVLCIARRIPGRGGGALPS